jgi:hypothetical protein
LGSGDPNFFSLDISSSWVEIRLHIEYHTPRLSISALKVSMAALKINNL